MKKTTKAVKTAPAGKGFLTLAGEAFHVLGEEIIEGKDKVVEVTSEKFTAVKKAIGKIIHKKAAPKARTSRKAAGKVVKKAVRKSTAKVISLPKKAAGKAAKKVAGPKRKG